MPRTGTAPSLPEDMERVSAGRTWLPLAFVLLSLGALILVPFLVEKQVREIRDEIQNVADPAQLLTTRITLATALEAAALRGFFLSGDERFVGLYEATLIAEGRTFQQLQQYARHLGPEVVRHYRDLRAVVPQWHSSQTALLNARITPEEGRRQLAAQQELLAEVSDAALRLERAIAVATAERRDRIRALEQLGFGLTIVLVLIALAAALVVALLVRRQRLLAAHLERRARTERELRKAARDLTEPLAVSEVLHRIAVSAASEDGTGGAYVEQIDSATNEIEIAAVAGFGAPPLGTRIPFPGSLTARSIESGEPEIVTNWATDERPVSPHLREMCAGCSALVIPLISETHALGALVLLRAAEQAAFPPEEVTRAQNLANFAALALRKVILLEEAERRRDVAEQLMEQLRRQAESKARLLRGVSHDVKNPLGAAMGYTQLLEDGIYGELTAEQHKSVKRVGASLNSALSLIEDLLELARAEGGQLAVDLARTDMRQLIEGITEEYRAAARTAGHTLTLELPEVLPEVETDAHRVRQIFGNLVSNAIKYTPQGGHITIKADIVLGRRVSEPECRIALSVVDTGPGIPRDRQEYVFEEFSRLDLGSKKGAGLGLAISQRIARLLGGEITLQSEVGQGSKFTLWLPVSANDAANAAQ